MLNHVALATFGMVALFSAMRNRQIHNTHQTNILLCQLEVRGGSNTIILGSGGGKEWREGVLIPQIGKGGPIWVLMRF